MQNEIIDNLLNLLDKTINSNSYWLTLSLNQPNIVLEKVLLEHLQKDNFQHQLVKEDLRRGLFEYSEMVFVKGFDASYILPKSGKIYNGNRNLTFENIKQEEAYFILFNLLDAKHLTHKDIDILENFFEFLKKRGFQKIYNIKTDFLHSTQEVFDSNDTKLGYFEKCDKDLALAILFEDEINILLINGDK